MKKLLKIALLIGVVSAISFVLVSCNASKYDASDAIIIDAKTAKTLFATAPNVVVVDMQDAENYANGHVANAVNITKDEIVISIPVENTITSKNKLTKLLSENGVSNESLVIIYDDQNDSAFASRMWWTLMEYGHKNLRVVSGGAAALKDAGVEFVTERAPITPTNYVPLEKDMTYYATTKDVMAQVDNPDPNVLLLDVRTEEEYNTVGKIPTAVIIPHTTNFYKDNTFKSTQTTRIDYLEKGFAPERQIIIYCKTGIRASVTFLRLYDAGYRNIKLYDGSYTEWSGNSDNPIDLPQGGAPVQSGAQDNS